MTPVNRKFDFEQNLENAKSGGILDIPHLSILKYQTPAELLAQFERDWGTKAEAVVLPAVASDGLLFEIGSANEPMSRYRLGFTGDLRLWDEVVLAFARLGVGIYLSMDPTLSFVTTDALHIADIVGNGSQQCCVVNMQTQNLVSLILGKAVDRVLNLTEGLTSNRACLRGVVLDIVNLWPMGGDGIKVETTCFCDHCQLEIGIYEDTQHLINRLSLPAPNAWNIVLKPTRTGMEHLDEIRPSTTPADLVRLCRLKGFDRSFEKEREPELERLAGIILEYTRVRHRVTMRAIKRTFEKTLRGLDDYHLQRIILTEGSHYSWTSGLMFEALDADSEDAYDELWFDPTSTAMVLRNKPFRSYMWRRTRYYIDELFLFVAGIGDPQKRATTGIARLTREEAKNRLQDRLGRALGTKMTGKTPLASLPPLATENREMNDGWRTGFVGVALVEGESAQRFVQQDVLIAPGLADLVGQATQDLPRDLAAFYNAFRQHKATEQVPEE